MPGSSGFQAYTCDGFFRVLASFAWRLLPGSGFIPVPDTNSVKFKCLCGFFQNLIRREKPADPVLYKFCMAAACGRLYY